MNESTSDTLAALMLKHIEDAARAEHLAAKLTAELSARTGELGSMAVELTAERTRRLKAEEVVDTLLVPVVIDDDLPDLIQEAKAYRTQYPRVGEEQ